MKNDDSMICRYKYLNNNGINIHHPLIKALTKRGKAVLSAFSFHRYFFIDEDLMRIYLIGVQYHYIPIHHFIKIIRVFPDILSSRCNTFLSCGAESNGNRGCSLSDKWCR